MSGSRPNPPQIFDRALIAQRIARSKTDVEDFVTTLACDDLLDRLAPITRKFGKALIMGPDARKLPDKARSAEGLFDFTRTSTLVADSDAALLDPENLHLPRDDYDLIVSILDLQIINDVPGFLARIRAHLAPDGLMLLAAIGGSSLQELRTAWLSADAEISGGAYARIAPFIDVRDAGGLLQRAGFALPMADIEHHNVRYGSPLALMRELHGLGATNPLVDRPKNMATKSLFAAVDAAYRAEAVDPDGRVRVTLEILWLLGWAPHESQQKPLAPGSAKVSLAQALSKDRKRF